MRRLGAALVERIRAIEGDAKFVIVEAASVDLALAMAEFWDAEDPALPRLAIAADDPTPFGQYALRNASAATLRHQRQNPRGVCVVVCEGYQLAERQSINGFIPVAPAALLESKNNLMLLAEAVSPVRRDGPVAAVREAIVLLPPGERPSAAQVARYFDAIAAGGDPLVSLPVLGGFPDPGVVPAEVRGERIKENLALAARRRAGGDTPRAYGQIRTRAQRVLGRRAEGDVLAARFMTLLEAGSDELLEIVTFDEAREILANGQKGLPAAVRAELLDYRRCLRQEQRSDADALPWDDYRTAAGALDRAAQRQDAARELLSFDAAEGSAVFGAETRRKLSALLRERVVRASQGSAPEAGLARAVRGLGHAPDRVTLVDPNPAGPGTQSAARDILSVACARYRLGGPMRILEAAGADVDGTLLLDAFDGLAEDDVPALFTEAGLDGRPLPTVRLRLRSGGASVEMHWAPDADDYALLRCLVAFADSDALTLRGAGRPTPERVAAAPMLEPAPAPEDLGPLVRKLRSTSRDALRDGLQPDRLRSWAGEWAEAVSGASGYSAVRTAEAAGLAGCVEGAVPGGRAVGMSPLAPVKSEWLADYLESCWMLLREALAGPPETPAAAADFDVAAAALATASAAHIPAFTRLVSQDEPLLPTSESRIWSVLGGPTGDSGSEPHALRALDRVLTRLIALQPEAAAHLKCLAVGPGAATLLLREAIALGGRRIKGAAEVGAIEIFAVGGHEIDPAVLAAADEHLSSGDPAGRIQLRYVPDFAAAATALGPGRPGAHFAVLTGLTSGGAQPSVNLAELALAEPDGEVLFAPRVWQRPETEQRILLAGPAPSTVAASLLRLAQRIDDRWPAPGQRVAIPEMRTAAAAAAEELTAVHDLAMWVATLDRYATRDSLERALGDQVAILHQEQRLGADSPIGLVVSQKSGGPVDRAIGRSLRQARIVDDERSATSLGADLRRVAAQGYGILALEAATSGTGINELVGHVVGFAMLGTASTPWPLPPGCRVVLVSLDEHPEWFLGNKRADLLALAIDVEEAGLHGAVIEVKARRSDGDRAASEGLDQLKKTLFATAAAAYPRPGHLASRIWLNRIAEAVYAVARESRIRLTAGELAAIEAFRRGGSTLEWAGVGLMFGPRGTEQRRVHRQAVDNDWVPIAIHDIRLTQERLHAAVATDLRHLYTAESDSAPLGGGRRRRRPEAGVDRPERTPDPEPNQAAEPAPGPGAPEEGQGEPSVGAPGPGGPAVAARPEAFDPPILGWDSYTGDPVLWQATNPAILSNGHMQIWGSSGAGKTQFVKMLLAQLATGNGTRFGIADFKNDYGPTESENFPEGLGAEFIDLWGRPGAAYNPLALERIEDVAGIDSRIIEFRDSIEQAMASYQRIGPRQKASIERALRAAYEDARPERRWPTMLDLNRQIGEDIAHILGDLTRYEIFSDGPPLAAVVDRNVVFGLNRIPGNGQTTVLAAAFLLAVIAQTMQDRPPIANAISYAMVVDEAHRVAALKAVQLMLREGRSKGLAVLLATQAPADLPDIVDANAQTRICFRLSDAVVAAQAARKLDQSDGSLRERIRTLGSGEAFVSLGGEAPRLLTMPQHYRDRAQLDDGDLGTAPTS